MRSIRRALDRGADGVEVDVRLSQDSIPILYHDPSLESMTDGQGCVSQTPAAMLTQAQYRVGWPADWLQHEQPVTLETLLTELRHLPTFPYLHLDLHEEDACSVKEVARRKALARRLAALVSQYHVPVSRLVLISNQPATLQYLRNLLPTVPLAFEMTEGMEAGFAELQHLPQVLAVVLRKDAITPERVAQLHALGYQVIAFGGRSARAVKRVVAAAPDAYQVDNVRRLQAVLRRRQQ
ncbi:glycerophosphodiester phosphodiesterase [Hymenobacter tenuis]